MPFSDFGILLGDVSLAEIEYHTKNPMKAQESTLKKIISRNKNCEIGKKYNFKDIKEELLKKGHIFKTKTDSEVLIHGYEEYGEALVTKLRGMFAFVIWNMTDKTLFGARDYFGINPFFYSFVGEELVFGSELKAFLHYPGFVKELNHEALEQYLSFQYSVTKETFLKNVFRLEPGHYFMYKDGKLETHRYFQADFNEVDGTLEHYAKEIDEAIRESVKAHKISDVEVGSFLSSGSCHGKCR